MVQFNLIQSVVCAYKEPQCLMYDITTELQAVMFVYEQMVLLQPISRAIMLN